MLEQRSEIERELDEIVDRLADLAATGGESENIARELGAIRAQLRALAEENQQVGAQLSESLGLTSSS